MNLKLLGCIVMGVFVAHLAVFMMVFRMRTMGAAGSNSLSEPPNLKIAEEVVLVPETGTKLVHREITVSTALRSELYQQRPEQAVRK